MLELQESNTKPPSLALFQLGFRPFFLAAAVFGFILVFIWMGVYALGWEIKALNYHLSSMYWHAHEMIYGYSMAVIAGFLLTATRNWTQIPTISGYKLCALLLFWLTARSIIFALPSMTGLLMAIAADLLFNFGLVLAIATPLIKAKLWPNLGMIVSKLVFLLMGNLVYYLGLFGVIMEGTRYGLYLGLYIVLSLILLFGRRVIPFFIERGVGYSVQLQNSKILDISSMILFVMFVVCELINPISIYTGLLSGALFLLHSIRLVGWYTYGIWKKPMLWVIYLAYGWVVLGFALVSGSVFFDIQPYLATHAFAFGGIGVITVGMMMRVSLGHTGRDVYKPPILSTLIFCLMLAGAVTRVIIPLFSSTYYLQWVMISLIFWIIAFALLVYVLAPILLSPRIDGQPG